MAEERWRPVVGCESYYEVSDLGRVRSLDRVVPRGDGVYNLRGKALSPSVQQNGYVKITLTVGGVKKTHMVHRLVARAFIGEIAGDLQINHIDGNKKNNNAENLELVTAKQNTAHAIAAGLHNTVGERNGQSKLNEEQVLEIVHLARLGVRQCELARRYGVNRATIGGIVNGKSWKHATKRELVA
jgi:hypothetical protein